MKWEIRGEKNLNHQSGNCNGVRSARIVGRLQIPRCEADAAMYCLYREPESITRRRSGGRRSRCGLRCAEISLRRFLGHVEHDDLVRRARSVHVELDGLADRAILLFDAL